MNHNQLFESEDPLAGDIDEFVHPDETRTDEQIAYDEEVATRLHMSGANDSDEYWDEYDEIYGHDDSHEDQEHVENTLSLLLTKTVQDKVRELGKSEADYLEASTATLVLKDGEGNPSDNLTVCLKHPDLEAGYDFDGSSSFYLAPVGVGKDQWGRDLKYVDGTFKWDYINDRPDDGYSMNYAGGSPEQLREYVENALTEDSLARAELVDMLVPVNEQ